MKLVYFIIRAQTDNRISKSVTQSKIYTKFECRIQNQWEGGKQLNQIRNVEKHNTTNTVVKCQNYFISSLLRAQTNNRISKSVTQSKIYTEFECRIQNQWERGK